MKHASWLPPLRLFILIVFATVFIFKAAFAQLSANNLTWYTEKDGLPGTQVHKIIVDRFGYIWIGTINGLTQYDGYGFKRFFQNPNDPGSIKGLAVWTLFEDSKGLIWVGSQPNNLNVYNPITQSFKQYDFVDLVDFGVNVEVGINEIIEDNAGRMYFGVASNYNETISSTLLYLDEKEDKIKRFETPDSLAINNIISMAKDINGNIWIRSYGGIFKIDEQQHIEKVNPFIDPSKPLLKDERPNKLITDPAGYLWIITSYARLFRWDLDSNAYEIFTPAGIIKESFSNTINVDKDGNIWLGTNTGFFQFDPKTKLTKAFVDDGNRNFQYSDVNTLAFDSFGSLWIGTNSTGMYKYEERALFKSYRYDKGNPSSLTNGWVNHIIELKNGKILATTSGVQDRGLNLIDLQKNEVLTFPSQKHLESNLQVSSIFEHSPGEVYISTEMGLFLFSYPSNQFRKITLSGIPESITINYFLNDSRGNNWVFTNQGIYKKKFTDLEYQKPPFDFEPGDENRIKSTTHALESDKHGVWILTNDMLFLYDYKTNRINRVGNDKSKGDIFGTQDINSIYEDPSGIVWVGTWQGGLSRFDVEKGKIKTYAIDDGLPSMSIQAIIADEKNQSLWLSTFEGLSRFDIPSEKFYNYSIDDGIQSQLFADGSFLKTSTGNFVFGGSNGITVFDPDKVNRNSIPPKVFFTDLKLFNKSVVPGENSILAKPIYETDAIILEHNQNNISLEFIALHYSNPSKNKYAYKLENYEDDWRELSGFQAAFYPNLPSGEYIFRVKAANSNGVWNEEGAVLKISIKKPWWNTPWAYGLYGILLVIFGITVERYLRYRVINKEREKAQVKELAHAKEIEKAYTELKSTQAQLIQSEKMASLGELTAGIAHEIQNPLNFVNNFSEVSNELIGEIEDERAKSQEARDETLVSEILRDVKENLTKINHHGKRADAIVKGMLAHSRTSKGEKVPTDINALADEYLRLSYHGLRAKDKNFNADFSTDFDPNLPKVNVIPQDIGRVLLNIINNAFQAFNNSEFKIHNSELKPKVEVSTKIKGDKIEISVSDNGQGIPDAIKDKIFQPFFTTKPTGSGTGLGLSLSYDIIKAHGGDLRVKSIEGEGTEMIFFLPIQNPTA